MFFGPEKYSQRIMQDAFLVGCCHRMLMFAPPHDWDTLLKSLKFPTSNWNFSWVRSLGGRDQSTSKKIAECVFSNAFHAGALHTRLTADSRKY